MKWNKRTGAGAGYLGQGYEAGEFIVEETYESYNLQKQYGGRRKDYYWRLLKGGEIIGYADTAKKLKQIAENI